MIRELNGKKPLVAPTAYVNEAAYVVGDVQIGEGAGVWPGAVIRGDCAPIRIGKNTQVEDNSVLHAGEEMVIGDDVVIGHGVVLHCRRIGSGVLIGNNATVLEDVEIGEGCVIAANTLVPPEQNIPDNSFVMGVPGKIRKDAGPSVQARITAKREARWADGRSAKIMYPDLVKMYRRQGI